jgi:protein-tyrosine phosphatase
MPPFSVLHVCLGNICRSPMAERLLALRVAERAGIDADELVLSHSSGIGTWHTGQRMNGPAARELRSRGGSDAGFRARHIDRGMVEASDVILVATEEVGEYVTENYPDAASRTFGIRHFGRIVEGLDLAELPSSDGSPEAVYERGVALVALADKHRGDAEPDDLDDPWGGGRAIFAATADDIEASLAPLVTALLS